MPSLPSVLEAALSTLLGCAESPVPFSIWTVLANKSGIEGLILSAGAEKGLSIWSCSRSLFLSGCFGWSVIRCARAPSARPPPLAVRPGFTATHGCGADDAPPKCARTDHRSALAASPDGGSIRLLSPVSQSTSRWKDDVTANFQLTGGRSMGTCALPVHHGNLWPSVVSCRPSAGSHSPSDGTEPTTTTLSPGCVCWQRASKMTSWHAPSCGAGCPNQGVGSLPGFSEPRQRLGPPSQTSGRPSLRRTMNLYSTPSGGCSSGGMKAVQHHLG
mmetsp:Transcript_40732/g.105385  ORF Transcript_40732/g.105385 Transcript_40732/m.105385 type:complete len:273 (+) Transcript_40732:674-1492(+)